MGNIIIHDIEIFSNWLLSMYYCAYIRHFRVCLQYILYGHINYSTLLLALCYILRSRQYALGVPLTILLILDCYCLCLHNSFLAVIITAMRPLTPC